MVSDYVPHSWKHGASDLTGSKVDYYSPPKKFENKTGLTGIHTSWKMPDSMTPGQVEIKNFTDFSAMFTVVNRQTPIDTAAQQRVAALYDRLKELNPEMAALDDLKDRKPDSKANIVMGMTSQFNLDDIRYYLSTGVQERHQPHLLRELNVLEIRANVALGWVTSPATRAKIRRQMDNHPAYQNITVQHHDMPEFDIFGFAYKYLKDPLLRLRIGPLTVTNANHSKEKTAQRKTRLGRVIATGRLLLGMRR